MSTPRITVLMSVYNGEEYLAEAIESILRQTFRDFEFLIIDDGSTDGTKEIIESIQDSRIRLISRANKGFTASLNEGIEKARGEYIARQDADDLSLPQRLEREVVYLDAHPEVGMVGTNYTIMDDADRPVVTTRLFTHPDDLAIAELLSNQFGHGSVMMRKSVVNNVGLYDSRGGEVVSDYDLFCRISRVAKLANLKEPLYKWRSHPAGMGLSDHALQIKQSFAIRDREFKEQIFGNLKRYKVFRSIHPFSFYPGPLLYFDHKSRMFRDLAWLYRREGRWGEATLMLLAALCMAPWRRQNLRCLRGHLRDRSNRQVWEYEFI